ncbi:MAG: hypothetical protein ACK45T_09555 [Pseudanabaena sp.]|nr:hypothetical protein [Pseudanabaena sp. M051S1SP2A07QC]MCA6559627.1 hypothetical protein [Pseudanabaena sp. M079S1SP2A07QC]MCA6584617.1 hypothetical protein [Pseudanabaena sp. M34BS1SP1A06MG]MCA6593933.1 hypothetical protein [Pseudanabaena sp. M38BS1SP1A06MG]MCA6597703.1 hypothetical protein [Pseudanabaena sp. M046S1SP1A06QC]MCA6602801.1 hypothetical protein [Pseudanabaena sp. M57BS1SP1A06MG]MCA6624967.1 hypothetical protein [Pseudanabaena sp. M165S2SP1A06QC]MCE2975298.1 hypothetical prot
MSNKLMVKVALMWRSAEEGGRKRPIATADYAATAYFVDGDRQLFSVVLHFPSTLQNGVKVPQLLDRADMDILVPEVIKGQLKQGASFYVTEGARVVAEGKISGLEINALRDHASVNTRSKKSRMQRKVAKKVAPKLVHYQVVSPVVKEGDFSSSLEYEEFHI